MADAFCHDVATGVARRAKTLVVSKHGAAVVGTMQLITDMPPNQPHRAEVAKLPVHRRP